MTNLFKSKRGLVFIIYLIVAVVVHLVPELGDMQGFLEEVGVVVVVLLTGYSIQDAAREIGSAKGRTVEQALRDILDELFSYEDLEEPTEPVQEAGTPAGPGVKQVMG